MTTANNTLELVEDILRLMDERPDVLEAVRARVLTRELLEMPERLTRLETTVSELAATVRDHTAILKEHSARFDGVDARLDRLDARLGGLVGRELEKYAREQISEIAREAGDYTFVERLTSDDLYIMHREADTAGISLDNLKSFRRGDIIIRVEDGDGETCYLAVEVSFTADGRDTFRASRNAEYLARFTGRPAVAMIAAAHLDRRIEETIQSGDVLWYEMEEPH